MEQEINYLGGQIEPQITYHLNDTTSYDKELVVNVNGRIKRSRISDKSILLGELETEVHKLAKEIMHELDPYRTEDNGITEYYIG